MFDSFENFQTGKYTVGLMFGASAVDIIKSQIQAGIAADSPAGRLCQQN